MIEIVRNPKKEDIASILARPAKRLDHLMDVVKEVFDNVQKSGDKALFDYTLKFDKVTLSELKVSKAELEKAQQVIPQSLKEAIQTAKHNISRFHEAQKKSASMMETMPGITCWRTQVGIDKVGLYVPGGSAPLFSTVLMLGIPAKIAGCQKIILCTPPSVDGSIHPAILYAANLVGIEEIYKVGGIQAVAAMSIGTETVPSVYKIFGPGNSYVTAAKEFAARYDVAIDMPAGPSEVMVIADKNANPDFIAADLLSQAEHGPDSQVVLLSTDDHLLSQVREAVMNMLECLPRKELALKSLKNSKLVLLDSFDQIMDVANAYAPEHLIIQTEHPDQLAKKVRNAGSVFLGAYAPESFGDYASGTNHALPTAGFAKAYSGVSLDSFVKNITFQSVSKEGFNTLAGVVETMAEWEQLDAHKLAVSVRKSLAKN